MKKMVHLKTLVSQTNSLLTEENTPAKADKKIPKMMGPGTCISGVKHDNALVGI